MTSPHSRTPRPLHSPGPEPAAPPGRTPVPQPPPPAEDNARSAKSPAPKGTGDEALVVDVRGGISPAQMVENKLLALLNGGPLPVSHLPLSWTGANRNRP